MCDNKCVPMPLVVPQREDGSCLLHGSLYILRAQKNEDLDEDEDVSSLRFRVSSYAAETDFDPGDKRLFLLNVSEDPDFPNHAEAELLSSASDEVLANSRDFTRLASKYGQYFARDGVYGGQLTVWLLTRMFRTPLSIVQIDMSNFVDTGKGGTLPYFQVTADYSAPNGEVDNSGAEGRLLFCPPVPGLPPHYDVVKNISIDHLSKLSKSPHPTYDSAQSITEALNLASRTEALNLANLAGSDSAASSKSSNPNNPAASSKSSSNPLAMKPAVPARSNGGDSSDSSDSDDAVSDSDDAVPKIALAKASSASKKSSGEASAPKRVKSEGFSSESKQQPNSEQQLSSMIRDRRKAASGDSQSGTNPDRSCSSPQYLLLTPSQRRAWRTTEELRQNEELRRNEYQSNSGYLSLTPSQRRDWRTTEELSRKELVERVQHLEDSLNATLELQSFPKTAFPTAHSFASKEELISACDKYHADICRGYRQIRQELLCISFCCPDPNCTFFTKEMSTRSS